VLKALIVILLPKLVVLLLVENTKQKLIVPQLVNKSIPAITNFENVSQVLLVKV
jgi:hypothetical protein